MGISDDITPRNNYRRSHSYPSYSQKEEPPAIQATDFVKIQKEVDEPPKTDTPKVTSDISDDFFENYQQKNRPENKNKSKDDSKKKISQKTKRISGWIIFIFLICLSAFLAVNNFQKIKRLFKLDSQKNTLANSEQTTSENLDTYVSEIKPQDYTDTTSDETAAASTTSAAQETNTAAAFDKTSLTIQVLNGNGITNSASLIKKTLETAGFKITSTGNASNFAYERTFVYYKTGKEEGADLVKDALNGRVVTVEKSDTKAKTHDIVVVIGKQ